MMSFLRGAVPRLRPMLFGLAVVAALGSARAYAGDGVQFSTTCDATYVNKKVGDNEQWAITWLIFGNASGNVFKLDGSPPSFIECEYLGEDGANSLFDCFGASACAAPPCSGPQWTQISTELAIPTSFFLPPGVSTDEPDLSCVFE